MQRIDVFEQVLPRHEFCKRFAPSSAEAARHKHARSGTRLTAVCTLMTFVYNVTICISSCDNIIFFLQVKQASAAISAHSHAQALAGLLLQYAPYAPPRPVCAHQLPRAFQLIINNAKPLIDLIQVFTCPAAMWPGIIFNPHCSHGTTAEDSHVDLL